MSVDFDIQQPVFSPDGEYLEEAAIHYRDVVMERFADSQEGQDLVRQGGTIGWADTLMDLGMGYLGVTPAAMTAEEMKEVLFELFPRKVSADPGADRRSSPSCAPSGSSCSASTVWPMRRRACGC
jgi:hypothetical protein